jgi:hypothetical protein
MIVKRMPIVLVAAMLVSTASGADVQENTAYENPVDVEVSEPQLTPRAEPMRDFPVEQVLDVTNFGAVPDDDQNDAAGIRAAMKQATQAKVPTEVRFPRGRYYLDADIETDQYAKITNDALAMARAEQVLLKPGRWHTSNADGLHFPVARPGPWIEGCTLEGMADDCDAVDVRGNTLSRRQSPARPQAE